MEGPRLKSRQTLFLNGAVAFFKKVETPFYLICELNVCVQLFKEFILCVENSEVVVEIVLGVLRIQTEKFDQFFARWSSFWSTEVSK